MPIHGDHSSRFVGNPEVMARAVFPGITSARNGRQMPMELPTPHGRASGPLRLEVTSTGWSLCRFVADYQSTLKRSA
jgi:hypothetical protein